MLRLLILSFAICTAGLPLKSGRLVPHGRVENLPHRTLAHQPLPRYQAGHVFSVDSSMGSVWVDSVAAPDGDSVDHAITLPDSFRVMVSDVAISFDGDLAVAAEAMDRSGRLVSVIAWIGPDGLPTRVVRTSPFAATGIGFTADGSLWAAGIEKINRSDAHPSHDVVRQYDPEGTLVRSLLSRAEFSSDHWHPAYQSLLVTSRHYVAFVSQEAGTWTLISTAGVVVGHGRMRMGEGFRAISAAVTDSGRLFVSGLRSDGRRFTMFELGSATVAIDTSGFVAAERFGPLAGSDGESLVFLSGRGAEFIWGSLE